MKICSQLCWVVWPNGCSSKGFDNAHLIEFSTQSSQMPTLASDSQPSNVWKRRNMACVCHPDVFSQMSGCHANDSAKQLCITRIMAVRWLCDNCDGLTCLTSCYGWKISTIKICSKSWSFWKKKWFVFQWTTFNFQCRICDSATWSLTPWRHWSQQEWIHHD